MSRWQLFLLCRDRSRERCLGRTHPGERRFKSRIRESLKVPPHEPLLEAVNSRTCLGGILPSRGGSVDVRRSVATDLSLLPSHLRKQKAERLTFRAAEALESSISQLSVEGPWQAQGFQFQSTREGRLETKSSNVNDSPQCC